jgi:multicomponent Na+:H+ antiporter subunit C
VSRPELFSLLGVAVAAVGLLGAIIREGALRRLLALNVMGAGVFLVLLGIAARAPGEPDPVPQALVLTGVVVAVSLTAFGLVLAGRLADAEADEEDDA